MTRYFDLSQPIQPGMTIYPGDPVPSFGPAEGVRPAGGSPTCISAPTPGHTSTALHIISPPGRTWMNIRYHVLSLRGLFCRFRPRRGPGHHRGANFSETDYRRPAGRRGAAHPTGWDRYWNTGTYFRHPYLSPEAVQRVIDKRAWWELTPGMSNSVLCRERPTSDHLLLGKEIFLVENLANLSQLQPAGCTSFPFSRFAWQGRTAPHPCGSLVIRRWVWDKDVGILPGKKPISSKLSYHLAWLTKLLTFIFRKTNDRLKISEYGKLFQIQNHRRRNQ